MFITLQMSNVVNFSEFRVQPDESFEVVGGPDEVIVIDNGSDNTRLGWSSHARPKLAFKPVMARTRSSKKAESELLVANDLLSCNAGNVSSANWKSPFDRHVVTQFEAMETILDYGLAHLGLDSLEERRVLITEAVENPDFCRGLMNELLFECYNVKGVSSGVDGVFSLNANNNVNDDYCLIVSFGFHTVHFIPVIDGRICRKGLRRLNVGGFHLANHLQRSMQLKYPSHAAAVTVPRAEEMLFKHCKIVEDFQAELRKWESREFYDSHVLKMQLPFTEAVSTSDEAQDPEALKRKRRELAMRLVAINQRKREEKIQRDENIIKSMVPACKRLLEQGYDEKVKRMLAKHEIDFDRRADSDDLAEVVDRAEADARARIEKAKASAAKRLLEAEEEPKKKKSRDEMNEEEREKFDAWIKELKSKRAFFLERRQLRHQRREQLAKRRTAASQERMRVISQLAKHTKKEDDFGRNDDDWDVYNTIRRDHGESDSEEEQVRVAEIEATLKENDEAFRAQMEAEANSEVSRNSAEWHQLHLAAESIRTPEILFEPSIVGCDQAGVSECLAFILDKYDEATAQKLVNNVFVTGAPALFPGLKARLERDLREVRPAGSSFKIHVAEDPALDAWKGAAKFARNPSNLSTFVSKAEYEEKGSSFFIQHDYSNLMPE